MIIMNIMAAGVEDTLEGARVDAGMPSGHLLRWSRRTRRVAGMRLAAVGGERELVRIRKSWRELPMGQM